MSGLLEPASQGRTLADLLAASEHPPDLTCVRPGDRLSIQIPGQPELGRDEVVVPASGEVPIAPEQTVQATGLLVTALEARVSAALAEGFLKVRPQVSVRVLERAPRRVQVLGRVGALTQAAAGEAQASLVDLPLHRPLGVYELLNGARGLSSDADAERLVLVRGDGPARRCYRLSYAALVRAHLAGREAWLEPDDQVVVPRLPDVYVLGSVQLPGRYPLRPGQTVAALLLGAGGPAEPADLAHARLLGPGGRERPAGPDALPAPGEVLFVPGGDKVYVVGPGVRRNGSLLLPPNGLSALQAISEAGWFTETADRDGVVILRRRGQTRARLPVPVTALLEGAQEEGRFRLLPGDTVLVPGGMW
ncbi:MAG: SLBB domain-containing protein [Planctomycetota bacterium]